MFSAILYKVLAPLQTIFVLYRVFVHWVWLSQLQTDLILHDLQVEI